MDPRTFLKPEHRPEVAPVPTLGEARPVPGDINSKPALLVFLRHVGCPFAEKTMRDLGQFATEHPDIHCIAVSHGTPEETQRWCDGVERCESIDLVHDPGRELYAQWGLGLTPLAHWLGVQSLSGVAKLASQGIRNRHPSGTRWQSAGAFGIDTNGEVVWRHIPANAADLADFDDAGNALGE